LKITIIVTMILFIYAAFSTIYHDSGLIGDIGKKIGETNLSLFGHVAYINLFILFYPLYKLYSDRSVRKDIDFYLGWILLFISLILLSALILESENVGSIGTQIVAFLQPLIGKAGLWLFWLMITTLSMVFIVDEDFKISGFDISDMEIPRLSMPSFLWMGSVYTFVKSAIDKILTNPFSSPALEDEMMPVLEPTVKKSRHKATTNRVDTKNLKSKKTTEK